MRTLLIAVVFTLAAGSAAAQLASAECLACHDTVHAEKFAASVHAPLDCTGCHSDITQVPHDPAPAKVDCASCHPDSVDAWNHSLHAKAVKNGTARGAQCADCHGSPHEILPSSNPASMTAHGVIPKTCATCHAQKFVMEKAGLSAQSAISYESSVHGRAIARGSTRAAVCTDCHDHHNVRPANDPLSGIFKFNVGRTCGQCHAGIAGQYHESVHGKALARGNGSTPVCTDCHGIHTISQASDLVRGPRASCARCHEGVRLSQELGIAGRRVTSYESSYHGLARQLGSATAADCASCHGAHNVLPSSDPRSAIHPANLTKTCGKCHEGAQANFARGKVHVVAGDTSDAPSRLNTWIRRIYMVLIVSTIGFMVLHNILIWWRKARAARLARGRTVVRMNRNQRIQHIIMVISFAVLVVTGFALAWPTSVFAAVSGPEEVRRLIHRIAAVVMMILGVYHLGYMTLTREGRKGLRDFWFRFSDARDLMDVLRNRKSRAGRFTYAEKAEYWAGLWGTIVMAITGLMIWYSVTVATWIPRWWIDIATTIHYYEAILATLAIVVWHIYHVIFDPDVYPMSWQWFDGKMSEKQFRHEHPAATPEADDQPTDEASTEPNPETDDEEKES
ncbi:MAG: cytochrome c3 family protein [Acidobacteriota bacterium]|nr:cytochrome c3 family protein [Acidobacteriota bacterium]